MKRHPLPSLLARMAVIPSAEQCTSAITVGELVFGAQRSLPVEVADLLMQGGHQATTVPAQKLTGKPDNMIARVCAQEGFALLTLDTEFADVRIYPPPESAGIIVF